MKEEEQRIEHFLSSLFGLNASDFERLEEVLSASKSDPSDVDSIEPSDEHSSSSIQPKILQQNADKMERIADLFFAAQTENANIPSLLDLGPQTEHVALSAQGGPSFLSVGSTSHALVPVGSAASKERINAFFKNAEEAPEIAGLGLPSQEASSKDEEERILISSSFDSLLGPLLISEQKELDALALLKEEEERLLRTYPPETKSSLPTSEAFFERFSPVPLIGDLADGPIPVVVGEAVEHPSGGKPFRPNYTESSISQDVLDDIKLAQLGPKAERVHAKAEKAKEAHSQPYHEIQHHASDGVLTYSFEGESTPSVAEKRVMSKGSDVQLDPQQPHAFQGNEVEPREPLLSPEHTAHARSISEMGHRPVDTPRPKLRNAPKPTTGPNHAAFEMMPPTASTERNVHHPRSPMGTSIPEQPTRQPEQHISASSLDGASNHLMSPPVAHHYPYTAPNAAFQAPQAAFVTGSQPGFRVGGSSLYAAHPPHSPNPMLENTGISISQTDLQQMHNASVPNHGSQSFIGPVSPQITGSFPVIQTGMYQLVDGIPQPIYPTTTGQWTSQAPQPIVPTPAPGPSRFFFMILGAALSLFVLLGLVWLGWFYNPLRGYRVTYQNNTRNAQTAPVVHPRSTVALLSTPEGASIFIDGAATARTTPARLQLRPGTHSIRITLQGHQPITQKIWVQEGKHSSFSFRPKKILKKPELGVVFVSSDLRYSTIYVDGKKTKFRTPAFVRLAYGVHTIRIKRRGYWRGRSRVRIGKKPSHLFFPWGRRSRKKRTKKKKNTPPKKKKPKSSKKKPSQKKTSKKK